MVRLKPIEAKRPFPISVITLSDVYSSGAINKKEIDCRSSAPFGGLSLEFEIAVQLNGWYNLRRLGKKGGEPLWK
jgi:hypothetical protein